MTRTADDYRQFGAMEARGRSPLYEELSAGVAADPELIGLLDSLPPAKRQPNLLFAATRHVAGTPADYGTFRRRVLEHWDAISSTMLTRRTQTNEPGRCTALYPVLASLPQPVALVEVGASAGLCLQPDRYAYDYGGRPAGDPSSPLRLSCRVEGSGYDAGADAVTVAWRAGIDLNPLDVGDPGDVRWLRTLVWPEQHERLARLDAAIALAQPDPPRVVPGDLNTRLAEVVASAPPAATLVVFHSAVLWYLPPADRETFVRQMRELPGHWIAQEAPGVLDAHLPEPPPADSAAYVLALDGRPLAFTALHGGWLRWFPAARRP